MKYSSLKSVKLLYVLLLLYSGDAKIAEETKSSSEEKIGKVTHYFTHIGVAVVELIGAIKVGDTIHIKGATSDLTQKVDSIQIDQEDLEKAEAGQSIGMKVKGHVREHDVVFRAG